jgi:hypothetical protein
MGLHIHNLGGIPVESDRKYFVYVLDYGWKEPLTEVLIQNFTNMARMAADSKSIVVAGINPIHFANQVFSWHGINGEAGEKVLPAIMVTSLHPRYFLEHNNEKTYGREINDKLLLIPLKKVCKTTDDVIEMIKSIFKDIADEKNIMSFEIAKEIRKTETGRATDALILEPNFYGIGVKIPQLFKWLSGKI